MQWFSYSSHGVAVLQYVQEFHSSAAQQFHSSTAPHVQEQEQCIWRNASHRVARKQLGARLIHFASFHALLDCERLNDDVDGNFIWNYHQGPTSTIIWRNIAKIAKLTILGIPGNLAEIMKFCQNCEIQPELSNFVRGRIFITNGNTMSTTLPTFMINIMSASSATSMCIIPVSFARIWLV